MTPVWTFPIIPGGPVSSVKYTAYTHCFCLIFLCLCCRHPHQLTDISSESQKTRRHSPEASGRTSAGKSMAVLPQESHNSILSNRRYSSYPLSLQMGIKCMPILCKTTVIISHVCLYIYQRLKLYPERCVIVRCYLIV